MPSLDWCDDQELGPGFRQLTLSFTPDYDGEVTASVVRNRRLPASNDGGDTSICTGSSKPRELCLEAMVEWAGTRGVNPIAKSFSNLR